MLRRWRTLLLRALLVLMLVVICLKLRWVLALPAVLVVGLPELIIALLPKCPTCERRVLWKGRFCRRCRGGKGSSDSMSN